MAGMCGHSRQSGTQISESEVESDLSGMGVCNLSQEVNVRRVLAVTRLPSNLSLLIDVRVLCNL